ncbi:MAG: hypothetical protein O2964_18395, partial [Verrucomicrobia bacterium]|nr:hypothetical protein [Verrucomicrobiota bacterium]
MAKHDTFPNRFGPFFRYGFVAGAIWILALSVFIDVAIQGIPFAKSDSLSGHLTFLTVDQWLAAIFSMANLVRITGVILLAIQISGRWKRHVWIAYLLIPTMPLLAGGIFINTHYFIMLVMPWYLVLAMVLGPSLTVDMFFQKVDGEFFIDGGGWFMQTGWWLVFCFCCWVV